METKRKSKWTMKEILLLVDEVHQRNHYFGTTLNADSEDAWKSIANKIIASFILVVCTPSRCKKKKKEKKKWCNILSNV